MRPGAPIAAFIVGAALALAGSSAAAPAVSAEHSLGDPKAPVTVIEYASLGCSHCGTWSREVFPEFKRRFIDTGKVRFVLREMLNGDAAVSAAGFLTAGCAGEDKYFQVVEGLFDAQPREQQAGDDLPSLIDVAARAGLSRARLSACLSDQASLNALEARADAWTRDEHVSGTPTFDVAGRRLIGETSLTELADAIEAARSGRRR